jgi:hypothetical protein
MDLPKRQICFCFNERAHQEKEESQEEQDGCEEESGGAGKQFSMSGLLYIIITTSSLGIYNYIIFFAYHHFGIFRLAARCKFS